MSKLTIPSLLLATALYAQAASYTLTYISTINYTEDSDAETTSISTTYGTIAQGASIQIQLTYDLGNLVQSNTYNWGSGSGVAYSSAVATTATIDISSGYSYSGPVSGTTQEAISFFNQEPSSFDQANLNDVNGNPFIQFNDGSSTTFTTNPLFNDSLTAIHDAFMTAVNNGNLEIANGGPSSYALPGIGSFRSVFIGFDTPSVVNIAPTAVPEPSGLLLAVTGLLPLLRRRRKA